MAASDVASAIRLIGSFLIQEGASLYGVEDQVQGLQEELQFLQQYLQDADSKQEERDVSTLVCQVRKLAYDAEDVIDSYILKVQLRHGRVGRNWLVRFADLLCKFPQIYEVREQIKVLQENLKLVSEELKNHGVMRIANLERGHISREDGYPRQRPRSYPHDDNAGDFVVGMEDNIQKLVDMVMGEGRTQVGVISIVGMGGSGKTTLARKLYNHPYAKECFDCSAWVFVSQEWSTQHILSVILRKIDRSNQRTTTLSVEELVDKIRCILEKKSYLVVTRPLILDGHQHLKTLGYRIISGPSLNTLIYQLTLVLSPSSIGSSLKAFSWIIKPRQTLKESEPGLKLVEL